MVLQIVMDLRQLQALRAVAAHRSFSATGLGLREVQSNVFTHISQLEEELRAVLLNRSSRELTYTCEFVADRTLQISNELRANTRRPAVATPEGGSVRTESAASQRPQRNSVK